MTGHAVETAFDAHARRAWSGRAQAYASSYGLLCAHTAPMLLDAAGVGEGAGVRVLDVGTGPGTVAALAVARGARVTAVDAEPSMLATAAAAVPQAAVVHAVLPELPFADGEFDAAVGNFVVNHVGRPRESLAELRRVTRPGGRVAVTIWPMPYESGQAVLGRAAEDAGVERPPDVPQLDPEHDFDRDEQGLAGLLSAAGLAGVSCRTFVWDHVIDADVWWSGPASGIGALGQMLTRLPAARLAEVRSRYETLVAPFRRPDGLLALPHKALLATAQVP